MNDKVVRFAAAWSELWNKEIGDTELGGTSYNPIKLDDTPAYPLARTVTMPVDHNYETGALSFCLKNLEIHGMNHLDVERCTQEIEGERVRLKLLLECLNLQGYYSLNAKPDPLLDMDTGGNLMELPSESRQPVAAGSDSDNEGLDPEKEEWLDGAREQRTRLSGTENGQKLLALHGEHNEVYDEVFRTSGAMRNTWQAGGVTRAMAADTSNAVKNDSAINNNQYISSSGETVSYNSNAFTQQLALGLNTLLTDPDFDVTDPTATPAEKYQAASKAALSFGQAVKTQTGNDKQTVQPLTPSQVYDTVNQHQGELPPVSDDDVNRLLQQGASPGGSDEDGNLGWIVLDEEDRNLLRRLFQSNLKERAEKATIVGYPLFEGRCEARIGRVETTVELMVENSSQGQRVRSLSAQVELPAFELDIDDSTWTGEAGKIARQRLEQMYFIRSLLQDAIVERLQHSMLNMVETTYNAVLKIA